MTTHKHTNTPPTQRVPTSTGTTAPVTSPPAKALNSSSGTPLPAASDPEPEEPEKVGYGRPPSKYRYKPGTSGNPRGRPVKLPTPEATLAKLMGGKIAVSENGITKKISRHEILMHQLFKHAIKGNTRAVGLVLSMTRQYALENASQPDPIDLESLTDEELKLLYKLKIKIVKQAYEKDLAKLKKKHGLKDGD